MEHAALFTSIEQRLAWLSKRVELRNRLNLTDLNVHAEFFYCEFLNRLCRYQLKKIDIDGPNTAAIDLGDDSAKLAIQVTANANLNKIRQTMRNYKAKNLDKTFTRLIILRIAKARMHRSGTIEESGLRLNLRDDLWDLGTLLGMVQKLSLEDLRALETFVRNGIKYPANTIPRILDQEMISRWRTSQTSARNRLLHENLAHRPIDLVESPLWGYWQEFATSPSWHEQIAHELHSLTTAIAEFSELHSYADALSSIDSSGLYTDVTAELQQALPRALGGTVARLKRNLYSQRPDDAAKRRIHLVEHIEHTVSSLHNEVGHPSFGKCFCVMGAAGSGKSHFLACALAGTESLTNIAREKSPQQVTDRVIVALLGSPYGRAALSTTLLETIRDVFGVDWIDLEEVDQFLSEHAPATRLVVAIDDLQNWCREQPTFTDELTDFISRSTNLHTLYWAFTLRDSSFDLMSAQDDFWTQFAFAPRRWRPLVRDAYCPVTVAGWIVLDELNMDKHVGVHIVRKHLNRSGDSGDIALKYHPDRDASLRHLSTPFIAWIVVDLLAKIEPSQLINLNFIELIRLYWKQKRREIASAYRFSAEDIDDMVALLAEVFFQGSELSPGYTGLVDDIVDRSRRKFEFEDREYAKSIVDAFVNCHLLRKSVRPSALSPVRANMPPRVEMGFDVFWFFEIANSLYHQIPDGRTRGYDSLGTLLQFFEAISVEHAEGIFEFLLLLVDQDTHGQKTAELGTLIWKLGIQHPACPTCAVLFAASKCSERAQRLVYGDRLESLTSNRRDLFAFLFFTCEAAAGVIGRPERLLRLEDYFCRIGEESLSSFLVYVVAYQFRRVRGAEELVQCIRAVECSRDAGVAEDLARETCRALHRFFHGEPREMAEAMMRVLERPRVNTVEKAGDSGRTQRAKSGKAIGRDLQFREALVFQFCSALLWERGFCVYELWDQLGWFSRCAFPWPVWLEVERESSIAMGNYYRSDKSLYERYRFVEIVVKLMESEFNRDRERAFHLIRHAISAADRIDPRPSVDPTLVTQLWKIWTDPTFRRLRDRFRDFFQRFFEE